MSLQFFNFEKISIMLLEEKKKELVEKILRSNDEELLKEVEKLIQSASVQSKLPIFGEFKGMITVPDDFNEPLDDFKEYTE